MGKENFPDVKMRYNSIQQKECYTRKKGRNYCKVGTEMSICCEESSWGEYCKENNGVTQQFALFLINAEMLMAAFPKSPLSWGTLSFWNAQHQMQNSTSLTNRDCVPAVLSFQVELAVPVKPKSLSVNTRLFLSCPLPAFLLLSLLPHHCVL